MTTATATEPSTDAATSATALRRALVVRVDATTTAVRHAVERALERVRVALDLPSRGEVAALSARLDAIDARLAALGDGTSRKS